MKFSKPLSERRSKMSTYQHNIEFNTNFSEKNLRGSIEFPILLPVAKKNYFLRPVAMCSEGG